MKRLGGVEDKPRVSAAVLAKMLAVDIDIGDARRTLEDQVKLLALRRGIDGHLPLVPAFGQRVVGGAHPCLKIVRHRNRRPGRRFEAVGVDVRQRVAAPAPTNCQPDAVEQLRLPWRTRIGDGGAGQNKERGQRKQKTSQSSGEWIHKRG